MNRLPLIRIKEVREMSQEKRDEKLSELQVELSRLMAMVKVGGSIENPSRIKEIRRAIARILTVENEEELGLKTKR